MQAVHVKLNSVLPWHITVQQVNDSSPANRTCVFKKETRKVLHWNVALYGAETWTLRNVDQQYQEVLKCGAGEGWRRSAGSIL
jgi:hypothetical protein